MPVTAMLFDRKATLAMCKEPYVCGCPGDGKMVSKSKMILSRGRTARTRIA